VRFQDRNGRLKPLQSFWHTRHVSVLRFDTENLVSSISVF